MSEIENNMPQQLRKILDIRKSFIRYTTSIVGKVLEVWCCWKPREHQPSKDLVDNKIWDILHDLVPFVQFKKRENTHVRVLTFSQVADFTKSNNHPWVFFTFLKLYKWYQIAQRTKYIPRKMFIGESKGPKNLVDKYMFKAFK